MAVGLHFNHRRQIKSCCDYNKGIYIYCLVGICIGDSVIFLQGTQFSHKAIAKHCNCESFKCVFLLAPEPGAGERSPVHSAGLSESGSRGFGRSCESSPQRWGVGWSRTTLESACHEPRGTGLSVTAKYRRGTSKPLSESPQC